MEFIIGNKYKLTNKWKKSYLEETFYKKNDSVIKRTILWRSGTWTVTVSNQDEVEKLKKFSSDDYKDRIIPYEEFEEVEFDNSWDGVSEDWETVEGDIDVDDLIETHEENMEEDEDYEFYSFDEFLEDGEEYEISDDSSYYDETPLIIEAVE